MIAKFKLHIKTIKTKINNQSKNLLITALTIKLKIINSKSLISTLLRMK